MSPPHQVLLEEVPQHASADEVKVRAAAAFLLAVCWLANTPKKKQACSAARPPLTSGPPAAWRSEACAPGFSPLFAAPCFLRHPADPGRCVALLFCCDTWETPCTWVPHVAFEELTLPGACCFLPLLLLTPAPGMAIFCVIELVVFPKRATAALHRQAALNFRQAASEVGALWDVALHRPEGGGGAAGGRASRDFVEKPPPGYGREAWAAAAATTGAAADDKGRVQEKPPAARRLLRRAGGAAMLLEAGIQRQRVLSDEAAAEPHWCGFFCCAPVLARPHCLLVGSRAAAGAAGGIGLLHFILLLTAYAITLPLR